MVRLEEAVPPAVKAFTLPDAINPLPVTEIAAERSSEKPSVAALLVTLRALLAKVSPTRTEPRFTEPPAVSEPTASR
jgi:hypothetical protein